MKRTGMSILFSFQFKSSSPSLPLLSLLPPSFLLLFSFPPSLLQEQVRAVTGRDSHGLEEEVERLQAEVEVKTRMLQEVKRHLREAVERERAGSHDEQVGAGSGRERESEGEDC